MKTLFSFFRLFVNAFFDFMRFRVLYRDYFDYRSTVLRLVLLDDPVLCFFLREDRLADCGETGIAENFKRCFVLITELFNLDTGVVAIAVHRTDHQV
jgi:hypothetical protein